jgi:peptidoglycan/xylan/chitin deacetylase (PgdA/CDA1 family)
VKALLCLLFLLVGIADAERPGYVTVLLYHRFGESKYPTTNISPEKFREQLQYLRDEQYRVLSMDEFRTLLENKEPFPQKSVLITIDDAYRSIYENAFPLLMEFAYPFTLFANTSPLYSSSSGFMTWEMLEEMRAAGVTIGNHSHFHPRLGRPQEGQTREEYAAWVRKDLLKAQRSLSDHGMDSDLLAYPYGEYNETVLAVARELGFALMFAQDEGGVDEWTDAERIPRVAIVGADLDMERFVFKLNLAPLHVVDLAPQAIDLEQNPPASFSLRLAEPQRYRPGIINMFLSEWGRLEAQYDAATGVLSHSNSDTLMRPMNRLIVTAREKDGGHFSMFSRLYFRPFVELGGKEEESVELGE